MINNRIGQSNQAVYGYKADIWALGIILFEMAFGFRPLQHLNGKETKLEYLAQLRHGIPIPDHPDKQLRKVLEQCLCSNPDDRPSAEKLLKHRFLTGRWF
jgi:serine/threonine protein kinase